MYIIYTFTKGYENATCANSVHFEEVGDFRASALLDPPTILVPAKESVARFRVL